MTTEPADEGRHPEPPREPTRAWLAERTYSEDEQNVIILTYATLDGRYAHRKEWALTSFTPSGPTVTAAVTVDPRNFSEVSDDETRRRYAVEARRVADAHDPDDSI